ncbi:GNAT family N-acetyltransferase [Rhizobacter sp. SG703]|uniref:GNAT family N-acetyltransferase n=1 Tax=Rhizobacter sp. SG703 TaxID=2587140 RepID=UPI00180848D1|nr:RimJ/RimL family protein N-acetyltransferase [Rhizobacter sp. SG703]
MAFRDVLSRDARPRDDAAASFLDDFGDFNHSGRVVDDGLPPTEAAPLAAAPWQFEMGDTASRRIDTRDPMEPLRFDGMVLRPWTRDDARAMAEAARESTGTIGRWMDWCHPGYGVRDAIDWVDVCADSLAQGQACEFGLFDERSGRLVGGAGLNQFNTVHRVCNLGYWVRQSAQGQGIATRAARSLASYGFSALGFQRIEIVVAEGNEASLAVARKLGAQFECLARNRLVIRGNPVSAWVHSLVP